MEKFVTRFELREMGMSEATIQRRLTSGTWIRVLPGVYLTEQVAPTQRDRMRAATLWAPEGVLCRESAASLHGLSQVSSDYVHINVPRRKHSRAPWLRTHYEKLAWCDIDRVGPMRVTSACRTLIDLSSQLTPEELGYMFDDSIRLKVASLGQYKWRLDQLSGIRGLQAVRELVCERANGIPASRMEGKFLRVLKERDCPIGIMGFRVEDEEGEMFIDMAFPDIMLAIECESFLFHSSKEQLDADCRRRNRLFLLGWQVLYFTWDDITYDPERVVRTITKAVNDRRSGT